MTRNFISDSREDQGRKHRRGGSPSTTLQIQMATAERNADHSAGREIND